jgi:glycosyltransferase involved in cell wall biosynthesis
MASSTHTSPLPTVSVVIPCYNVRQFVAGAVQSVLDQADAGVECVVVDDGSTDGSGDLIEAQFGARVTLIRQKNQGVAVARTRGFEATASDLVVWLDSDDMLTEGTLASRRAAFRDDPSLQLLVGQVRVVDVDTGDEYISPGRCDADYLARDLIMRTNLPHSNILTWRRDAVAALGLYDPSLHIVDDYDLWLRAWPKLRWRFVRQIQSMQRNGSFPSLTKSRSKFFHYEQIGLALQRNRQNLRDATGSDRAWQLGYAHYAADLALMHLREHEQPQARQWAMRAIRAGGLSVQPRVLRYLVEACLPPAVYEFGRSAMGRLGVRGQAGISKGGA